ncbi:MAG: ABC transporter ATP-binding protein/permease [Oscillospiraceae bacterium]|nr:ABC transporter ATP-binding protein/permease [Oscillospiraceae bacterium]
MLQLKKITKDYVIGTNVVNALRGIELKFRQNEFVSILGPSGCGKTTMLNLLGGLDIYTSGDLIINGKSTKDFTDREWDIYRNRRIGFVFQNYNLIPHQTVLRNVELALTLSGVSKTERRRRALEVLDKVGLADQVDKKPGQMSGGQMQRVSIARALINNPDILLADEPTGALDSGTSEQIMALIKDIAKERLVIMVTHNSELAEKYSTRIIKLFDGKLVGDSNPYEEEQERKPPSKKKGRVKKSSMSFATALSLSANNLLTKKTRTFMTAFAGSIGIIGIALIMALSSGSQAHINRVQQDTLAAYPLLIEDQTTDLAALMNAMNDMEHHDFEYEGDDNIYSVDVMKDMLSAMLAGREENDLKTFKTYLEQNSQELDPLINAVAYGYNVNLNIFASDYSEGINQINPFELVQDYMGGGFPSMGIMGGGSNVSVWEQLIDNQKLLDSQYDVIAGRWPQDKHEIILAANENNGITDYALYSLGLKDRAEIENMLRSLHEGTPIEQDDNSTPVSFTYDELLDLSFKMVISPDMYQKTDGWWVDMSKDEEYMKTLLDDGLEIKVVGIVRPSENASSPSINGAVGYTAALTDYIIDQVNSSELVVAQKADMDTDVFSGGPFADSATYEGNLEKLGVVNKDVPNTISIYPRDFESKEKIVEFINTYNSENTDQDGNGSITYTDYVGMMMSAVSTVINMISAILMAFVGISLVVSSIMIGIITYVSVLERTREIGILKSIGASKKDISRVFNAETLIIGFVSGSLGILITGLLIIPANIIINAVSGVTGVAALPPLGALLLVVLSMGLTLIAGLIPSKIAAKKDPVVALRTE